MRKSQPQHNFGQATRGPGLTVVCGTSFFLLPRHLERRGKWTGLGASPCSSRTATLLGGSAIIFLLTQGTDGVYGRCRPKQRTRYWCIDTSQRTSSRISNAGDGMGSVMVTTIAPSLSAAAPWASFFIKPSSKQVLLANTTSPAAVIGVNERGQDLNNQTKL